MPVSSTSLSKRIAHALRHDPQSYGLEPDSEGWVQIDDLLSALRRRGSAWSAVGPVDVERMLASSSKRRYEVMDGRIRALYGHSLPGRITCTPGLAPSVLFHGTAPSAWNEIQRTGLQSMGRQFVHLSVDAETALSVGRRKHPQPVVLQVDAGSAQAAGISFYPGNEVVWLAEHVPADFVTCLEP